MKKIVALTDHSVNANHATRQALQLAGRLHTNLLLAHGHVLAPMSAYDTVVPLLADENLLLEKEGELRLKNEVDSLSRLANILPAGDRKPGIGYIQMLGDPASLVKEIGEKNDVELFVLGESRDNAGDHFFFGSDTRKVLERATRPVLLVPVEADLKEIQKVVFATDFDEHDLVALKYLLGWAPKFNFELLLTHVNTPGHPADRSREDIFKKKLDALGYQKISYHDIGGAEIPDRLNSFARAQKAALLAVGHRQHGLVQRLLHKSVARGVISGQRLPVVVFPSSMSSN